MGEGRLLVQTFRVVAGRDEQRADGVEPEIVLGDEGRRCRSDEGTQDGVEALELLLETLDPPGQLTQCELVAPITVVGSPGRSPAAAVTIC